MAADDTTVTDDTSTDQQQTTTGDESSDQSTQQAKGDPVPGAPESYEPFELPDDVQLNEELMGEFSQLAKDANLPQDKAQGLVGLGAKMAKGFESAAQESLVNLKKQFVTDLTNDKELGGEELDANLATAQRAINAYGSDELKAMLTESGLNRHPELVRFFHAVGKTVSEDTTVGDTADQGGEKSLAERMYGTE